MNGEGCRASLTCFLSSLINFISQDTNVFFSNYHASLEDFEAQRASRKSNANAVWSEIVTPGGVYSLASVTSFHK